MNSTVSLHLAFADSKHELKVIDLSCDLSASPSINDPARIAGRLAELHGLTPSQQAELHDSICDQLHNYALYALSCQGKTVGSTSIQQSGLHLANHSQMGQLALTSAVAFTGGPTTMPAQYLLSQILAAAGVHAAPAPALGHPPAIVAAPPAASMPSGMGHQRRVYMTKRRRLEAALSASGAQGTAAEGGRSTPSKTHGTASAGPGHGVQEDAGGDDDGNVDYCHLCDDAGDLVCCDRCPRSYHLSCLKVRDVPDGEWRCPVCVTAFGADGEHETEAGSASGPIVTALFKGPFNAPRKRKTTVQEELWDILETLRDNEFAPSFLTPVDVSVTPGYSASVKHPRDLGTIRRGLEAGSYGVGSAFDPVRVIGDLRLVFHNCRWYNKPLSTIWRMADVLFRELETALRDRVALTPSQAARLEALRDAELPQLPPLPSAGH